VQFPHSGVLTFLQFGFSAGSVRVLKAGGLLEADDLIFAKAWQFSPAVLLFYTAVATNMRFLSKSTAFKCVKISPRRSAFCLG